MNERKDHWEKIYETKQPHEVSWTQSRPAISLEMIRQTGIARHAAIIDIGGGDSNLVDHLLEEGYTNITVLDISAAAIERAKKRLGLKASLVKWIVTDILDFKPSEQYELWHDRAAFHFLTNKNAIGRYRQLVAQAVTNYAIVGTFSVEGPKKCSGLEISQYDEQTLPAVFSATGMKKIFCKREDHHTPFGTTQNFVFCSFGKK
ncbi:MAG: class I SAM-dependent methyltransferase [Terrimonas ferruginea]|uniref:class I SAM-dependent methyltransferase n=1 Tax=Terrimonas ferruginea TaxID=249 RepID=UPI00092CD091|nr:class I SAM-dependent methyltransferase [Terrimonas ferruginea]MBN8783622.1 class I SAM-dependent methyltransferase [Terrimonas ferruginea]OJW40365.1 MAG: SAM-dependent methyltransferase [Sphingobacteriales bacterium 48-107]